MVSRPSCWKGTATRFGTPPSRAENMRVAFVTPRFFPCHGWYENYVLAIAQDLVLAGHRVGVFTTNALELEYFWRGDFRHLEEGKEVHDGIAIFRFAVCHRRWLRRLGRV